MAFAVDGRVVFASTYDAGTCHVYRSMDAGQTWAPLHASLPPDTWAAALAVAPPHVFIGTIAHGLLRSDDLGTTWQSANEGLPPFTTILSLTLQHDALFAGIEAAGLFRCTIPACCWQAINQGLPLDGRNLRVAALLADETHLFAGHFLGLHRTMNRGTSWQAAHPAGLPGELLTLLAVRDGLVYASGREQIYCSTDAGSTWTTVSSSLRSRSAIRALAVHGSRLFAGTRGTAHSSVYRSTDGGLTWTSASEGLPADAWSISLAVTDNYLLAGVGEHGIWRRPLEHNGTSSRFVLPFLLEQNIPNPFDRETTIGFTLTHEAPVVLDVRDLFGEPVATLLTGTRQAGPHQVRFDAAALPAGFYVYRLTVGALSQTRQMLLLR